jgi:polyhydroxyalkanoate synthesis regulator protein
VTDSRTGDDITNLVLTQILLEKDQPKLDLFPSAILHMMIRTNRNSLRATFERFYSPFLTLMATSQKQMDAYLRKAMHGQMMTPLEWARGMMQAFSPSGGASTNGAEDSLPPDPPPDDGEIEELRDQLTALKKRLDELSADREAADRQGG